MSIIIIFFLYLGGTERSKKTLSSRWEAIGDLAYAMIESMGREIKLFNPINGRKGIYVRRRDD